MLLGLLELAPPAGSSPNCEYLYLRLRYLEKRQTKVRTMRHQTTATAIRKPLMTGWRKRS